MKGNSVKTVLIYGRKNTKMNLNKKKGAKNEKIPSIIQHGFDFGVGFFFISPITRSDTMAFFEYVFLKIKFDPTAKIEI
jgi:hypothetical protein